MNWKKQTEKKTEKEVPIADLKPQILHALNKADKPISEYDLVNKMQDGRFFFDLEALNAFPQLIQKELRELESAGHIRRFADRLYPDRLGWGLTESGRSLLTEARFFTAGPIIDTLKRTAEMIKEIQKEKAVQTDTDIIRKYGKIEAVIELFKDGGDCASKVKAFSIIAGIIRENK